MIQPGSSYWAPVAVFRMVKAWNQWLVALIVPQAAGKPEPTQADFERRIRESIGDDSLPIDILSTSMWTINDVYAERYTEGRIFCMGDAVHRHPPTNGLGSNTCVQDAFNLAWKLALVVQGKAAPSLLDSYDAERQPVGKQVVARANKSFLQNNACWDLLGGGTRDGDGTGRACRRVRHPRGPRLAACRGRSHEVRISRPRRRDEARYVSGAIVADGTVAEDSRYDPELEYKPDTRPGSALPHVWLTKRSPGPRISTLDVAGKNSLHAVDLIFDPVLAAWTGSMSQGTKGRGSKIVDRLSGEYCQCAIRSARFTTTRP